MLQIYGAVFTSGPAMCFPSEVCLRRHCDASISLASAADNSWLSEWPAGRDYSTRCGFPPRLPLTLPTVLGARSYTTNTATFWTSDLRNPQAREAHWPRTAVNESQQAEGIQKKLFGCCGKRLCYGITIFPYRVIVCFLLWRCSRHFRSAVLNERAKVTTTKTLRKMPAPLWSLKCSFMSRAVFFLFFLTTANNYLLILF